ncbi:hypothetical protein LMG13195_0558, partial [Bifidobacterium bifidum LMG 13195]|uniref:ATP-binding protein n=1 Tax=Bifidobacterium bifidum TaxID=1681 RepID=UPI000657E10A
AANAGDAGTPPTVPAGNSATPPANPTGSAAAQPSAKRPRMKLIAAIIAVLVVLAGTGFGLAARKLEIASIGKARLLIIDELGYVPIDEEGSRLLFQVITNAYEMQSIVYTTNIEFSGWGRVFGDPNMAAAIIDRTVHHGRMLRFEGESYRRTHALMQ